MFGRVSELLIQEGLGLREVAEDIIFLLEALPLLIARRQVQICMQASHARFSDALERTPCSRSCPPDAFLDSRSQTKSDKREK